MNKTPRYFLLVFTWLLLTDYLQAQVKLPRLISDGMVLQRDTEVPVWGLASPGENLTVQFKGNTYTTTAGKEGKWALTLPPMESGGPYEMTLTASNQLKIKNILVGDVWVCSGQSNMELTMARAKPAYEEVVARAENSNIRHFDVPDRYNFNGPQTDLEGGSWISASPENVLQFSAVGYFFAKELYEKYQVPVGLINASLGGSPVEAWLSEEALKRFPVPYEEALKFKDPELIRDIQEKDQRNQREWYASLQEQDKGYRNPDKPWFMPAIDDTEWPEMNIPGYWADEDLGFMNGVVWFRKEIEVPSSMAGKPAELLLGRIVDSDSVFLNGKFIGTTGYQYPPRRYQIPENLLKEGKNILVVRIINNSGKGGFVEDKPYHIAAGEDTLDLTGEWRYKPGAKMPPTPGTTTIRFKPLGLYNGMIAPVTNYSVKGVIWYQGESNTGRPEEYNEMFATLIRDWRKQWKQDNLPFLFVQLANFMKAADQPGPSNWAMLREAQLKTLSVPNTAMAVTIDIGEWNDIHPLNKKDVGKRLALAAQKVAYGNKETVHSGPVFKSMKKKGNKIILSFTNTGKGLVDNNKGNGLNEFAIAGPDKKFVWAQAKIKGNKVVVWNENIPDPVAVRYAWADNPDKAGLYNKEGLPASPFRTDNWKE